MPYSDDPIRDFEQHDREQVKRLAELPVCDYCEEPIQDEAAYYINGEWYCENCLEDHFKRAVVPE